MWQGNDNSFSEGGYMNTTNNPLNNTENKGSARRVQNVMPLVIQQINNCEGEEFKLFGVTAQIIKLVGVLRNVEVHDTKATYTIEDYTGEMKCVLWLECDGDKPANLPSVKEGCYVQVFGSLRNQDGETMLMVLRMFPVNDCNIITTHLIRMICTRLTTEADSKKMMSEIKVNNPGAALANSMTFEEHKLNATVSSTATSGLTTVQEKVFKLLSQDGSINGMDRDTLLRNFPQNQHYQVNDALVFLSDEGHIYSTTDNDHFKVTTM